MLGAEDVLDGAEHAGLTVAGAHDCVVLHVGTNEVGRGAMRIDVVRSVLRIILDNDDQGVLCVGAVSHGLNQQADRVVIIRLLEFRGVDSPQGRAETPRVIVAQPADHLKRRQIAVCNELLELAVPFVEAPDIWVGLIVSAEVRILESILIKEVDWLSLYG